MTTVISVKVVIFPYHFVGVWEMQWLKWFCEAGGAHLTKPGWSIPTLLIWRYLGLK